MANLQYIGARYVPKFYLNPDDNSNDWKSGVLYEALTIVTYNNDSYTSKVTVPASVGNPADNPQYWACTTKYTAALVALQSTVGDLSDEMDIFKKAFVTPQMFGAIGDGVHDDTAAFNDLANESGNVFIPKGTYIINSRVTISNVICDEGSYPIYEPEYAKPLKLALQGLSYSKTDIALFDRNSYEEAVCYLNNKYYVVTAEYNTPDTSGINVFDSDMTLVDHVTITGDASLGVASNITTDGTYLYIDFSGGKHYKYNPTNLNTPMLITSGAYTYTCYYNRQLYGIEATYTRITISNLAADLITLTDSWYFDRESTYVQSAAIYKGQLIVSAPVGKFAVADLTSHEVLFVPYDDVPLEIESFFTIGNKLYFSGHVSGANGTFNIGTLDFGSSVQNIKYIEIDEQTNDFSANIGPANRSSIYHVINGKTYGNRFPSDDCYLIWIDQTMFCYSVTDNYICYKASGVWYRLKGFRNITTVVDSSIYCTLSPNDVFQIYFANYQLDTANKTIAADLSDIYTAKGWSDSEEFRFNFFAQTYGAGFTGGDIYVVQALIKKTSIQLQCRSLLNIDATPNAILFGWHFVH